MGHYIWIKGVKWYYRLKPKKDDRTNRTQLGLFSDVPRDMLVNNLIVSLSHHNSDTNKVDRLFAHFKSYLEYGIFQLKLEEHERCFYELILGESNQKPHFDIDIDNPDIEGDEIRDALIDSIIKVLKDKNVEIDVSQDILIFTSHGTNNEGKKKQSYHIVVNNYCHANNVEAKAFYHKVIDHVPENMKKWIDAAVYSPTQQFRIVGSRKIGSKRVKTFQPSWKFHDQQIEYQYPEEPDSPNHEFVMQLEASVVGFTGNCKFLPPFEPRADQIKHYEESEDVTRDEAKDAINLIGAAGKISITDPRFPYKFLGINGPIVMLKRTKPSRCKICQRVHEHENPYLLVIGDEKSVYFKCRRAPEGKSLFLGKLNPENPDDSENPNNPDNISPEQKRINQVKINWTKNVIDKVQEIARSGNSNDKKYIDSSTNINPTHKKQFIDMYINSK